VGASDSNPVVLIRALVLEHAESVFETRGGLFPKANPSLFTNCCWLDVSAWHGRHDVRIVGKSGETPARSRTRELLLCGTRPRRFLVWSTASVPYQLL
jgi:hypothetical protein